MSIPSILEFLHLLSQNNNREWFNEHKALYNKCKKYHEQVIDRLIMLIAEFDSEIRHLRPEQCTFRIYRDLRFSQDKTPYKIHFGAYIAAGGKNSKRAGYYLHLEPEKCFISGGIWMPESSKLKIVRQSIVGNLDEFEEIIHNQGFKQYFKQLDSHGRKLKTLPKSFPADFPKPDYLKFKDYTASHPLNTQELAHPAFCEQLTNMFRQVYPLNRFLNYALDESKDNELLTPINLIL